MSASGLAVRRLKRELECLRTSKNPQLAIQPSEENLLEWHFVLQNFPEDTPYHGGCYHGKIIFPPEYPHAPPAIVMITPSGRLETGKRLCLSMTDFHPESWNPAWSIETILVGLLSFVMSDNEHGYGAITATDAKRRALATESHAVNTRNPDFKSLFPELVDSRLLVQQDGSGEAKPDLPASMESNNPEITVVGSAAKGGESVAESAHSISVGDVEVETPDQQTETQGMGEDDAAPAECWICRDTTNEPLIQPCACRGSMSGVHASCVENWIRHHRRNAVNDELPCCSVCHQPYQGCERRPGIAEFLCAKCVRVSKQLLRMIALVVLLVGFQGAAQPGGTRLPPAVRALLITIFSIAALHKVIVLSVSLPPHRPAPQHAKLRWFFVADYRSLAMHLAEACTTVLLLAIWTLFGQLGLPYFLPFALASLVPMSKLCMQQPSMACMRRSLMVVVCFLLAPVLFLVMLASLVWRNPRRAVNPLDAPAHIYVALAAIPLCLICASNIPVIVLWAAHSVLVALGLLEVLFVKKFQWKGGATWLITLQLTALSALTANTLCEFPEGLGSPDKTNLFVRGVSTLWFVLVLALSAGINRPLLLRHYHTWQRRHGTFTLQAQENQGDGHRTALMV